MNRTWNWKGITLGAVIALVIVFGLQNTETMRINFMVWHFEASRFLVLLASFLLGILGGVILTALVKGVSLNPFRKSGGVERP